MNSDEQLACRQIIDVARLCYGLGICLTGGNVSARVGDRVVITPTGYSADRLGIVPEGDVCWVDLNGNIISGPTPSQELAVHLFLYRRDAQYHAIVHAHPPATIALAASPNSYRSATASARKFGKLITCEHDSTGNETLQAALERQLSTVKNTSDCPYGFFVQIPRHGVFAASESPARALYFVNKVEENARVLALERLFSGK
jgi:L-fuculose-phosphate aldolase